MRDQIESAGSVPHRDHEARKASTNSDMFAEAVAQATRDDFEFDLDHAGAAVLVGVASDPACRHDRSVASAWVGSDGAALVSIATLTPSWTTIIAEGALGRSAGTPPRVRNDASAGQVPVNAGRRDSLPLDDRAGQKKRVSTPEDREVHRRG